MIVYTRTYNAATGQFVTTKNDVVIVSRSSVATASQLPTTGNVARDARYTLNNNHLYVYLAGVWNDQGYVPTTETAPTVPPVTPGTAGDTLDIPEEEINFKSSVASAANLPASNNVAKDAVFTRDTNHLYIYLNGTWNDQGVFDYSDLVEDYIFQALS